MITDPAEMMAQKIANSPTGRRCHHCDMHIQATQADGRTVVLEAHPTEDGDWSIRADLSFYRTDTAVNRYRRHRCDGVEL